jgi:hypothetical protein
MILGVTQQVALIPVFLHFCGIMAQTPQAPLIQERDELCGDYALENGAGLRMHCRSERLSGPKTAKLMLPWLTY